MNRLGLMTLLVFTGCIESTGGNLVHFTAQARGADDARQTFGSPAGYDIALARANVTIGAMYFNQQNPQNYTLEQACVQDGIYSGEVRGGLVVDALNSTPQKFPVEGTGTDAPTRAGELWLTGGDLFADDDSTVILDVAGVAARGLDSYPFEARFTIGANRKVPPRNDALPGSNPLCAQRLVRPIAFDTALREGSTVTLVIDPRTYFLSVDFSTLTEDGGVYRFTDSQDSSAQADKALFNALRSPSWPYHFDFTP